jgi:hypothetical protein
MNPVLQYVFTDIFDNKKWGFNWEGDLTSSGPGSTKKYTENLRKELPKLYNQFNITSVLDAPCGDFNWMRLVVEECPNVDYIGGDIVKSMIDTNIEKFGRPGVEFIELDITSDPLPSVDLMICRDCLFHLPERDIFKFIDSFINSDIKYLLTTSYYDNGLSGVNKIINPGYWFDLNLQLTPYNFPKDALYKIDDWILNDNVRYMYLWDRDQIILARKNESI